jgi:hypothetical protein
LILPAGLWLWLATKGSCFSQRVGSYHLRGEWVARIGSKKFLLMWGDMELPKDPRP